VVEIEQANMENNLSITNKERISHAFSNRTGKEEKLKFQTLVPHKSKIGQGSW